MSLKHLSNEALDARLQALTKQEREILSEILLHIIEVDRRKLFLQMAYSNLFDYMTRHLGYSAGSAQRRIDAARLAQVVPEVTTKIEAGHVNLAQVSLIQKAHRQTRREDKPDISPSQKRELISDLVGKTFEQSQVLVAKTFNLEIKEAPRVQHQANESVRFEVSLSKEQWEKMERMRTLLSNSLPSGSWDQVLEYAADKVIQQKDKVLSSRRSAAIFKTSRVKVNSKTRDPKKASSPRNGQSKVIDVDKAPATYPQRRHIPLITQRTIYKRDKSCSYKDPQTGKTCGSTWKLNIDHIQPVWAEGNNLESNLRILCASHNRDAYRKQAGLAC
ncbi:hypothetical protein D3C87_189940 [compost metagenome]